jgi:hypothetical protein
VAIEVLVEARGFGRAAFSAVQTFKMYAARGNFLTTDYSDYTD